MIASLHPAGEDPFKTAADPARSVWVAANAGTGKTHLLVERIARLLLAGVPPGRILCLAFTRAAASEMANRLNDRLGNWAAMADGELEGELGELMGGTVPPPTLNAARRLFAETLEVPKGLQIRTIHAFCESLLGRFPLEADVAPHFSVIDERTAGELRTEARDRVLAHAHDGDDGDLAAALSHLAGIVDEGRFATVMGELDANRGRLRGLIAGHGGLAGLVGACRGALGLDAGATSRSVLAQACAPGAFDEPGLHRAAAALDDGTARDRKRAAAIRAWLGAPQERADAFTDSYRRVFLTAEGTPSAEQNLVTKTAQRADPAALGVLLGEQARIHAVRQRLQAVAVAEATAALLRIGASLLAAYDSLKRARALLDYDDLILTARRLLAGGGRAGWVHYKLDGGIDHILVDEAQDTSPEQWEVVTALAEEFFAGAGRREGRTVFAVGDEKQSIYSFQGADPDAFDCMRAYFAERVRSAREDWKTVTLAHSFRATRTVLDVVDGVFSRPETLDGVTSAGRPTRHVSSRRGQAGLVEVWPTIKVEAARDADPWDAPLDQMSAVSPPALLARHIADRIGSWLEEGEILESADRPIRPDDIMILVRKRAGFVDEMVRCLKERGIRVAGTDRMVLTDQLAVMDLVALGNFVLLPEDDLNLAVVLKAPMFGFDDDALFDLAHGRRGSLWETLKGRRGGRFEGARKRLFDLLALADYTPPFEFFADVLGRDGDRRRILGRLGPDARDPLDEFLSLALDYERRNAPSLQGFLHWIAAGKTQIKRDLEHGRGEVRVMTVHAAKGLESPIVFLPDTCRVPDPRVDPKLLWGDAGGAGFVLWPAHRDNENAACQRLREAARLGIDREYRRLLYVAMTRARDRLYVCGWEGKRARDGGCWYDLVAPTVRAAGGEVSLPLGGSAWRVASAQTAPADKRGAEGGVDAAPPLPSWATRSAPAEPDPPRPLAPSRPEDEEPPVHAPFGVEGGARLARGRLIHRLLQSLPELEPGARAGAARAYLARAARGLAPEARAEIAAETLAVLADPAFEAIFGPGSQAEVPLVGIVGGRVVSARVDRLLVTGSAVTVIDYKTNRAPPATEDQVPALYLGQMAAYRVALGRIYPGRPVHCLLLWTDGPRLMALPETLLDQRAP